MDIVNIEDNNKEETIIDTKPNKRTLDISNIKTTINSLIIHKVLEGQDIFTNYFSLTNPIAKLCITYGIFNAPFCFDMFKQFSFGLYNQCSLFKRYTTSLLFKHHVPIKKTFEINYIGDNVVNQLYLAFDWYLKTHAKKAIENHIVVQMNKQIQGSKEESKFEIQKSIPRDTENTFVYSGYTFYYTTSEFEDKIYGVGGKINKMNYKLLLWSFECNDAIIDEMSTTVLNMYARSKLDEVWKQKIYNHKNGTWEEASIDKQKRKITSVILDNNMQDKLETELKYFTDNEIWFNDKNIPYKRSYLFYGPPGTGKTSMIKAISYELQRHIYYLNLANIKNDDELTRLMGKLNFIDIILIIEDIDAQTDAVKNRQMEEIEIINNKGEKESKPEKTGITLAGLLNQIDGVHNNYGMILIMTTNRPDDLDKALTREGRVDEKIYFGYASNNQIFTMFDRFYDQDNIVTKELLEKWNRDFNVAPAAIENAMVKNYKNCANAFEALQEYKGPNGGMEKFEY